MPNDYQPLLDMSKNLPWPLGHLGLDYNTFSEITLRQPDPPKRKKVYVIGSLRNAEVANLARFIREELPEVEVFDDWLAAGPEADDYWRDYEVAKGNGFLQALTGYAAKHVFEFDKHHLDTSDAAILLLPAGKSGHLELGYMAGRGKPTAIMLESEDPERFDVMYQFADLVTPFKDDIVSWLKEEFVL